MNKNTIFAFALILGTVYFFNSPFYYENILKKPYPKKTEGRILGPKTEEAVKSTEALPESAIQSSPLIEETVAQESISLAVSDSLKEGVVSGGDTITVETDDIICTIDERGAMILSVKMKKYNYNALVKSNDIDSIIELVPEGKRGASLIIDSKNYDDVLFAHGDSGNSIYTVENDTKEIRFRHTEENGKFIDKVYRFSSTGYLFDVVIESPYISGRKVQLGWLCGIRESEVSKTQNDQQYDIKRAHTFDGKEPIHVVKKKPGTEENTGRYWWAGISSKYFLVALIPTQKRDADLEIESYVYKGDGKNQKFDYAIRFKRIADESKEEYRIFAGPMRMEDLKSADEKLNKVLYSGWRWFLRADLWFPTLCEWVLQLLVMLQGIVKDYGIAIVILTILVKLVTYPMTHSSTKSMTRMKDIQPKVTNIRNRYKGNPQKMNEEIMALYKKEGINPMNPGCLPMFLQMPILFSLFIVLRKAIELRGSGTIILPYIKDLSQAEALPIITPLFQQMVPNGLPMYGNTVGLMPIAMAVLTYFQNKATIKDPNQKAMIYIMPVFMLVLFNAFPSGLVLYWTLSSGLGLVQQYLTTKNSVQKEVEKSSKKG